MDSSTTDRMIEFDNQFLPETIFLFINIILIVLVIIFLVYVFRALRLYIKDLKNKSEQKLNDNNDKTI